jgi:hypothetical protein
MRTSNRFRLLLTTLILFAARNSFAQIFQFTGGTSTGAGQGGGLQVVGTHFQAWSGAGIIDGHLIFGAFLQGVADGYTAKLGDDSVVMKLPIDIFGGQSTIHTFGFTLEKKLRQTTLHASAGQMATGYTSPMFNAGTTSGPISAILFTDTALTPNLRLFSRNILSLTTPTSISGVEWKPSAGLSSRTVKLPFFRNVLIDRNYGYSLAFAGGVGSSHSYTSQSFALNQPTVDLKMAYVTASDGFQRTLTGSPLQSELDGANITGSVHPSRPYGIGFGHQNFLVPQAGDLSSLHAQVDDAALSWTHAQSGGPTLGSSFFRSITPNNTSKGASLWVGQPVGPIDLRINYLISDSTTSPTAQSVSVSTQEKLTPRLSTLQITSFSAGKTSVAFGGSILTNLFTVSINYQTLYVPLRPQNPFTQALSITLKINVFGNIRLSTSTSFDAQGKMSYTLAGSDSYYRLGGLEATPQLTSFRPKQYSVAGQVTTADGQPVYGAAIRIGKDLLFSDRDGHFLAPESKPGPYTVQVVLDQFIASGTFTVVSAPPDATATKDESAAGIHIVLAHP